MSAQEQLLIPGTIKLGPSLDIRSKLCIVNMSGDSKHAEGLYVGLKPAQALRDEGIRNPKILRSWNLKCLDSFNKAE